MKLAAIFALLIFSVQAQTIDARLDALVAPYREKDEPGMVAILIHRGRIVWQTAFGLADIEAHRAIMPDTQFELASMTKQFPAYARNIRIRDLLHHVSGRPDYEELMVGTIGDNFFRSSNGPSAEHEFTSAEVLQTLSRQPKLEFAPGSRFEYSNSGSLLSKTGRAGMSSH